MQKYVMGVMIGELLTNTNRITGRTTSDAFLKNGMSGMENVSSHLHTSVIINFKRFYSKCTVSTLN